MSDNDPSTLEQILRQRRRRTLRNVSVVLLLAVAALGLWWWQRPAAAPELPVAPPPIEVAELPPPPEPPRAPAPRPTPAGTAREEPPEPALPELDESDSFTRTIVAGLSKHPDLIRWMATDELIRRFVAAVDNVAEGRTPRQQMTTLVPEDPYVVRDEGEQVVTDPESFERYDSLTEVIVAIDSRSAARVYRELQPLIQEAYRDLGYPDRSFDDALRDALAELLATPVVVGEPPLEPRVISHGYQDPELEGLSAAQKQLLRLGPVNAPRIQRKLRELALSLGIPDRELPLTPLYQVPPLGPPAVAAPPEPTLPSES